MARALIERVTAFAAAKGGYAVMALHTDPRSPGAERFWRSLPTRLIHDDRDGPSGSLHFEMALPGQAARIRAGGDRAMAKGTRAGGSTPA